VILSAYTPIKSYLENIWNISKIVKPEIFMHPFYDVVYNMYALQIIYKYNKIILLVNISTLTLL